MGAGELESWRAGELESWRAGELRLLYSVVSSSFSSGCGYWQLSKPGDLSSDLFQVARCEVREKRGRKSGAQGFFSEFFITEKIVGGRHGKIRPIWPIWPTGPIGLIGPIGPIRQIRQIGLIRQPSLIRPYPPGLPDAPAPVIFFTGREKNCFDSGGIGADFDVYTLQISKTWPRKTFS
jgi:hypothetical protein